MDILPYFSANPIQCQFRQRCLLVLYRKMPYSALDIHVDESLRGSNQITKVESQSIESDSYVRHFNDRLVKRSNIPLDKHSFTGFFFRVTFEIKI